jgi:hypothetical protein
MALGYWFSPIGHVTELIKEWQPRKCRTEKDFERSLVRHLQPKLEGKDVIPQYGSGRVRGDIVVNKEILIEIKTNLNTTAKLHTLLGQIETYEREWKKSVIFVLCGQQDSNLVKQLKEGIDRRQPLLGDTLFQLIIN